MSKGGSHDPQVVADGCDRSAHARPLDRHWDCPGLRFLWRRFRLRFSWRAGSRLLRRVRWFLSGLLPLWLFPVLLLLLLIACSLRPETAQPDLALTPDAARWLASAEVGRPQTSVDDHSRCLKTSVGWMGNLQCRSLGRTNDFGSSTAPHV